MTAAAVPDAGGGGGGGPAARAMWPLVGLLLLGSACCGEWPLGAGPSVLALRLAACAAPPRAWGPARGCLERVAGCGTRGPCPAGADVGGPRG